MPEIKPPPPRVIPQPGDVIYPKCPHCNESPARVVSSIFTLGAFAALTIYCGNPQCAKIFTIVPIGPARSEEPLIAMPTGASLNRRTN